MSAQEVLKGACPHGSPCLCALRMVFADHASGRSEQGLRCEGRGDRSTAAAGHKHQMPLQWDLERV